MNQRGNRQGEDARDGAGLSIVDPDETPLPGATVLLEPRIKSRPRSMTVGIPLSTEALALRRERDEKQWLCNDTLCARHIRGVSGAEAAQIDSAMCCPDCGTLMSEEIVGADKEKVRTQLWFCERSDCGYHSHFSPYRKLPSHIRPTPNGERGFCKPCLQFTLVRATDGFPPWYNHALIRERARQHLGFSHVSSKPPPSKEEQYHDESE